MSLHITYKNEDMIDVEKCEINVTVGNGQNMKCEIKSFIIMNVKYGQAVKRTKALYVPQAVKYIYIISRLVSKGATMGATKDKITIKKNGISMILDSRKGQTKSIMFYLKAKRYSPEGK